MSDIDGVMAVWKREVKVFQREKSRIISSAVQPLMWLVLFGSGIGGMVTVAGGGSYQAFMFPGVLIMSVLFSSIFFGLYIVWDKKIDVLKAVLVAPVSRVSIFTGKVLGGCTDSLMQTAILLALGVFFVSYSVEGLLLAMLVIIITSMGFVALGLALGSFFESPEGFQLVGSFLIFPLFFMSGALYPLDSAPDWVRTISMFDPITYSVDAARYAILGTSVFPIYIDLAVISVFAAAMIVFGTWAFSRMK